MKTLIPILTLAALGAQVAASRQASHVCRFTGQTLEACPELEQSRPEVPSISDTSCCDVRGAAPRVEAALSAKSSPESIAAPLPVVPWRPTLSEPVVVVFAPGEAMLTGPPYHAPRYVTLKQLLI